MKATDTTAPALGLIIDPEVLARIEHLMLKAGDHASFDEGACVMEAVAWVAGEPWSDHPQCVSPAIAAFCRDWNDSLSDDDRNRILKPLIPRLIGTRRDDSLESRLAWMATDWLVRVYTPAWCDLLESMKHHAVALRGLPELVDADTAKAAQPSINLAKQGGAAAWDAAWAAAWDAARAAAGTAARAAARAAARDAAWAAAGTAARAAAGTAARAAARDAARDALKPTVATLQGEAIALLERMIETAKAWQPLEDASAAMAGGLV